MPHYADVDFIVTPLPLLCRRRRRFADISQDAATCHAMMISILRRRHFDVGHAFALRRLMICRSAASMRAKLCRQRCALYMSFERAMFRATLLQPACQRRYADAICYARYDT